jgi:hypothetical protein
MASPFRRTCTWHFVFTTPTDSKLSPHKPDLQKSVLQSLSNDLIDSIAKNGACIPLLKDEAAIVMVKT